MRRDLFLPKKSGATNAPRSTLLVLFGTLGDAITRLITRIQKTAKLPKLKPSLFAWASRKSLMCLTYCSRQVWLALVSRSILSQTTANHYTRNQRTRLCVTDPFCVLIKAAVKRKEVFESGLLPSTLTSSERFALDESSLLKIDDRLKNLEKEFGAYKTLKEKEIQGLIARIDQRTLGLDGNS
jgi:hypothetical protein